MLYGVMGLRLFFVDVYRHAGSSRLHALERCGIFGNELYFILYHRPSQQ